MRPNTDPITMEVALRWGRLHDGHPEAYARQILVRDNISWWRKHRRELLVEPPEGPPVDTSAATAIALMRPVTLLSPRYGRLEFLPVGSDSPAETATV